MINLIHSNHMLKIYNERPDDINEGLCYRYVFYDESYDSQRNLPIRLTKQPLYVLKDIYLFERRNNVDTRQVKYEIAYVPKEQVTDDYRIKKIKTKVIGSDPIRVDWYCPEKGMIDHRQIIERVDDQGYKEYDWRLEKPVFMYNDENYCGELDNTWEIDRLLVKIQEFNYLQVLLIEGKITEDELLLELEPNQNKKVLSLKLNIV